MNNKENSLIFEGYQRNLRQLLVSEKHKPGCTCKFCEMIKSKKKGKKGKKGKKADKKADKKEEKKTVKEAAEMPAPDAPQAEEKPWYDNPEKLAQWDKEAADWEAEEQRYNKNPEVVKVIKAAALEYGKKQLEKEGLPHMDPDFVKEIEKAESADEVAKALYVWFSGEGLDVMPKEYWGEEEPEGEPEPTAGAPVPPAASAGASEMPRV